MSEKTETVTIRVTSEFKKLLRLAAVEEQRTQTNLLERLLTEHCRRVGLLGATVASRRRKP